MKPLAISVVTSAVLLTGCLPKDERRICAEYAGQQITASEAGQKLGLDLDDHEIGNYVIINSFCSHYK